MRTLEHVIVDEQIVAQKGRLVFHVAKQPADERGHCQISSDTFLIVHRQIMEDEEETYGG